MIKHLQQACRALLAAPLLTAAGCASTYEPSTNLPSKTFDEKHSLGTLEVRYTEPQNRAPRLYSGFYRGTLKADLGVAGSTIFVIAYPTLQSTDRYTSITLEGEPLDENLWRFAIPSKPGWRGPQTLLMYFSNQQQFLFRYLEGQSCLNEYTLETPGIPTLLLSVKFKQPACLLPCSPSQNDFSKCSNRWR